MNKLPVGKTVRAAYSFTFGHLGTIIGLIWVPLVLSTLLNFLPMLAGNTAAGTTTTPGTAEIENLAISLLTLLLTAIIYVAITRQALGLRQGSATFHFALGQPEFRVFGAVLLVALIAIGPILLYTICIAAALGYALGQGSGALALAVLALAVAGGFGVVYIVVRLWFLVTPVTVCENQINLVRGWTLTRGNFWRILAVLLAVTLPIFVLEVGGILVLMGSEIAAVLPATASHDPQAIQQQVAALFAVVDRHTPALMFIGLLLAPFNLGLSLSASAFGYRELTTSQPAQ